MCILFPLARHISLCHVDRRMAQRTLGVAGLHPQPVQHKPPFYFCLRIMSPCSQLPTACTGQAPLPPPPSHEHVLSLLLKYPLLKLPLYSHHCPHCMSPAAPAATTHEPVFYGPTQQPALHKSCYTSAESVLCKSPWTKSYSYCPSTHSLLCTRSPPPLPTSHAAL